ncbi:MAG: hypothetical protein KAR15_07545, partial [Desulfobacterales bacterium]|nr:hypothetical protein [Desulfobacterales bacterium]
SLWPGGPIFGLEACTVDAIQIRCQVSGVRCQQTDDGGQKTEVRQGISSSSFYHPSSVISALSFKA